MRSRSQQEKEGGHIPDALERQIEKWMDQEGITAEDIKQTYHIENEQRKNKADQSPQIENYKHRWTNDTSLRAKPTRKNNTASASIAAQRKNNAHEADHNSNKV